MRYRVRCARDPGLSRGLFQICRCGNETVRGVVEKAQGQIATLTKQTPDLSGLVVVVNTGSRRILFALSMPARY